MSRRVKYGVTWYGSGNSRWRCRVAFCVGWPSIGLAEVAAGEIGRVSGRSGTAGGKRRLLKKAGREPEKATRRNARLEILIGDLPAACTVRRNDRWRSRPPEIAAVDYLEVIALFTRADGDFPIAEAGDGVGSPPTSGVRSKPMVDLFSTVPRR